MEVILTLTPGVGALPLRLGDSPEQVEAAAAGIGMAPSHDEEGVQFFENDAVQVEFLGDKAVFIGIAPAKNIKLIYQHRDILHRPASEVFDKIAANEPEPHVFDDNEYIFPVQIITLWDADPNHNLTGGDFAVWGQIGIGTPSYLKAIGY